MRYLRNFLSIPAAAILGIFTPGIYLYLAFKIEEFNCWLDQVFWAFGSMCVLEGYVLFFFPSIYFWMYLQLFVAGFLAGVTTIYIALKIAVDEDNLLYFSLFATSLIINIYAMFGNAQNELVVAVPTIISNIITFGIAGVIPLYMIFKNKKLSDQF